MGATAVTAFHHFTSAVVHDLVDGARRHGVHFGPATTLGCHITVDCERCHPGRLNDVAARTVGTGIFPRLAGDPGGGDTGTGLTPLARSAHCLISIIHALLTGTGRVLALPTSNDFSIEVGSTAGPVCCIAHAKFLATATGQVYVVTQHAVVRSGC